MSDYGDFNFFLSERIAEDEAVGKEKLAEWDAMRGASYALTTWSLWANPTRTLAECEAKRKIMEEHRWSAPQQFRESPTCSSCYEETHDPRDPIERALLPCQTLRVLAAVYSDHSDYREEWKPL